MIISVAVTIRLFDEPTQVRVFTSRSFEIEHQVLHAEAKIVKRLLEFTYGLLNPIAAVLRILSELLQPVSLLERQLTDLGQQFGELVLKRLLVHVRYNSLADSGRYRD